MSGAITQGADRIVALQKRTVPVKTGTLRNTIRAIKINDLQEKIVAGGPATTGKVRGDSKGGAPDFDYARAVEFGTAPHKAGGKFEGARHPGAAAHAFFYPSYRALKRPIKADVRKAIKKAQKAVASSA